MPKKALQQQLTELHGALASTAELDPELRALLKEVSGDIQTLLGGEASAEEASTADQLQARVRRATVDFEAEHPRLAHILGDLADTLTKLGI
ncbi:MAG: DUF4404 family protein [Gammaproteobacteria bacterium]|nr:DUF4404 family protein [Gammaproteobacteria bacterium]MDH3507412.1 DUF4404 family protein [Gammaproteobacteria bacterium]